MTMTLFLASFGSAAAELKRTKIGPDPYGQKESLLVNGSTGVFSYIAADGSLQVVELKCASFLGGEATDKGGLLCSYVFERKEGLTTEHYLIHSISNFTTLTRSGLVENSERKRQNADHYAAHAIYGVLRGNAVESDIHPRRKVATISPSSAMEHYRVWSRYRFGNNMR
ncbi:hypothetical protein [Agrobacterium cavarae]|uniref:hypothetical protein n=1 Tax=Agrobacterium cavarae TaxID=2528239 RepID=UPI0028AB5EFC|nr:hypothetical protein [Agrobacterium cavarae]